ncbi:MAG: TonB-dependent receptor [Thermoanaerobaculia bacterium]|nr:TonB-dependent receptor [Thermoanaerobaculia bacterium]
MAKLPKLLLAALMLTLFCLPVLAEETPADGEADKAAKTEEAPKSVIEDVIVVTGRRTEQLLHEVPAAISVITSEDIDSAPADDYGDLLRNVPGLNVSQMSARDIQISSRQATSSLATDQLVLLDGRTLYLDFFGFVMWDYLPVNPRELKQIEVMRGPSSAVWGANALSGVVNLITKSPRELAGTSVLLGGGELGTLYGSVTHARAADKLSYKLSAGYYEQDPYPRPTGFIPNDFVPPTPYPDYQNSGTSQPKLDVRVDYDATEDSTWSFGTGYSSTEGIMHSGIGPFDIDSGAYLSYAKASYRKRALTVNAFVNLLDGDASNLLTRDATGQPLVLGFESQTYNIDFADTRIFGDRHVITYGGTARRNNFDLTIAPDGEDRDEFGLFVQDEILLSDKVRWLIGARFDDIDPIGSVVSPRTSLLISPSPNHTFRLSYNQAYRAPSLVENYISVAIVNQVALPTPFGVIPFAFPTQARGNPDLEEEDLEAYEVGYVGTFGKTSVSLSIYQTELEGSTDFFPAEFYSASNPPPGWPLPPIFVPPGTFPSLFSYRNIGKLENQGVELGIDYRPSAAWKFSLNGSYQEDPEVTGIPEDQTNHPPNTRFNLGAIYNGERFFANANLNYADEAFWTDVLDSRFWGFTDSYTQVNLGLGYRFNDKVTVSLNGSNIFDERVQQHIFGDIIERKIVAQVQFDF